MSEGRKTRRFGGGAMSGKAKEKAKLDREWQQISAVSHSKLCVYVKVLEGHMTPGSQIFMEPY